MFSPVAGLGARAKASLADLGKVSLLLAPNHYHNKALAEYQAVFPKAKLCASKQAIARISDVTGLKLQSLVKLESLLPKNLSVVHPAGLKTGEVWITTNTKRNSLWFVVDAFSGAKMSASLDRQSEVGYLKTFPTYGVGNKAEYQNWISQQLVKSKPATIVPCHGAIMSGKALYKAAQAAVDEMLG